MSSRSFTLSAVLAVTLLMALPQASRAGGPAGPGVASPWLADRVLVAFQPRSSFRARLTSIDRLGLLPDTEQASAHFAGLTISPAAKTAGRTVGGVIAALRQDPAVRVAEPDYILRESDVPNDARFGELWGMHNTGQAGGTADADIDAPEAWDVTTGSASIIVAVIDTGVDYNHEDLRDNILRNGSGAVFGFDYANNDADPIDDEGHGTHCAGTIGAVGNNTIGVAGVCHRVRIMPMKFLTSSGSGSTANAIKCIDFARQNGARVMSNSWGGGGASQLLLESIQRARDAGILFVAAAGNSGQNTDVRPDYPASYNSQSNNVVSVAATNDRDSLPSWSNYGPNTVDIAAPGVNILSTRPGNAYQYLSGTSMATPHVAGAAALVLAADSTLTLAQLKARLVDTADRKSTLTGKVRSGRLNVNAAVRGTSPPPPPPPSGGDAYEPDDTATDAKAIAAGATQNRSIHAAGNPDWVQFTLSATSTVTLQTGGPAGDTEMWLYGPNSSTNQIAYNDDDGQSYWSRIQSPNLAPGTYFVRVQDYRNDDIISAYTLQMTATAAAGDAYEPDDSPAAAKPIAASETQNRSIHAAGNVDWATFTVTTRSAVTIQTGGPTGDTELFLYRGSVLLAYNDDSGGTYWSRIDRTLQPGTYTVRVQDYRNDGTIPAYTLRLAVVPRRPR